MKQLIAAFALLMLAALAWSQPALVWERDYYGCNPYEDRFQDVEPTSDGGYICGGYIHPNGASANVWIVRLNSVGDTLWRRCTGGAWDDACLTVLEAANGGYVAACNTGSFGAGSTDIWLLKYNAVGDTVWRRTYGGSAIDGIKSLQRTRNGGFILSGETDSYGAGSRDAFFVRTDSNGVQQWIRTAGTGGWDIGAGAAELADGGFAFGVYSTPAEASAMWVIRTNANGNPLWTRQLYLRPATVCRSICATADSGFVAAGHVIENNQGQLALARFAANGDTLWTRIYADANANDECRSVKPTADGGFLITGSSRNHNYGKIIKVLANGMLQWQKIVPVREHIETNEAWSGFQTPDGGYVVGGFATNNVLQLVGYAAKLAPDSTELVTIEPDTLDFGNVWMDRTAVDTFTVVNGRSVVGVIDSITSDNPLFASLTDPMVLSGYEPRGLRYAITLPDTLDYQCTLSVHCHSAAGPSLVVKAHGVWTELRAVPAAIQFGQVAITDTVDTTITLYSAGNTSLTILSAELLSNGFAILASPAGETVAAHDSTTITLRFLANNAGTFVDTLVIANSAGISLRIPLGAGVSGVRTGVASPPTDFYLAQNSPNPFNPSTEISFGLPHSSRVTLDVYDVLGRHTATLLSQTLPAGHHAVTWSCSTCPTGMYLAKLSAGDQVLMRKMLLMK